MENPPSERSVKTRGSHTRNFSKPGKPLYNRGPESRSQSLVERLKSASRVKVGTLEASLAVPLESARQTRFEIDLRTVLQQPSRGAGIRERVPDVACRAGS